MKTHDNDDKTTSAEQLVEQLSSDENDAITQPCNITDAVSIQDELNNVDDKDLGDNNRSKNSVNTREKQGESSGEGESSRQGESGRGESRREGEIIGHIGDLPSNAFSAEPMHRENIDSLSVAESALTTDDTNTNTDDDQDDDLVPVIANEPKCSKEKTIDAESQAETSTSWWSSMVQKVSDKSADTMNFVKKDLLEFTESMKNDVATVSNTITGDRVKEQVQQRIGKLWSGLGYLDQSQPEPAKEAPSTIPKVPHFVDRAEARLHCLQTTGSTYSSDPNDSQDVGVSSSFSSFVDSFEIDDVKSEIQDLLVYNVEMRKFYNEYVPSIITHSVFWSRYFFRLLELQEADLRRQEMLERSTDDDINDEDWEDADDLELASPPIKDIEEEEDNNSDSIVDNLASRLQGENLKEEEDPSGDKMSISEHLSDQGSNSPHSDYEVVIGSTSISCDDNDLSTSALHSKPLQTRTCNIDRVDISNLEQHQDENEEDEWINWE